MSFNGAGVFVRLYNWVNDAAGGIKIRADRMDNEMNGIATALSTCITKDGQTTVTANLPMAGFKHTGVASGSARTDYASLGQVQDGNSNWVDGGGTADAITATYSPSITALVDGQLCFVRATAANATTTPTFAPNGLTARTIVKNGGVALAVGDIVGDGHQLILRYDLTNTRWELLNPAAPATVTAPFIDSTAIIKGSADDTKLLRVEVDGITTGTTRVWTAPDSDLTVVGTSITQTISNKVFNDTSCTFADNSDLSKKLAFECSGITTGTTRTLTIPDSDGTIAFQFTPVTNSLGADVALNNTSNYFDGPSVAVTTGKPYEVSGTVLIECTTGGGGLNNKVNVKLWDGTTVIASTGSFSVSDGSRVPVSLSGYIASPAGNLRISVQNETSTAGKILYNYSGNSKDSTITAKRLA